MRKKERLARMSGAFLLQIIRNGLLDLDLGVWGAAPNPVLGESAALFVGICTARRAPPKAAARVLLRRRDSPRKRKRPLKVGRGHERTRPARQRRLLAFEGVVSRTTPRGSRGGDRFSREE